MQKVLFIDRDGTIIHEPPQTFQIDSLEKLSFLPYAISNLAKIRLQNNFQFVMVSNQDGLGTESYPQASFDTVQNKMLTILKAEGVEFDAIHIDSHFDHDKTETRKPGIGMLKNYFNPNYDLKNSFVIGDRNTDVLLAKNIGCKCIFIKNYDEPDLSNKDSIALIVTSWKEIYEFLKFPERKVKHSRTTKETTIEINLNLDSNQPEAISTGLGFFDHMLEQIAKHANISLGIIAKGDLHIDEHHTIEDVGIALGEAFTLALGEKRGIERYGFTLPMDDCIAQVALDFGGRNWIEWNAEFKREKIGEMPTEMFFHFFKSFSDAAKCNLNIKAEGENEHHKIESIFKAFAKSIKIAIKRDGSENLPSTKGVL